MGDCKSGGCAPIVSIKKSILNGSREPIQLMASVKWNDKGSGSQRTLEWSLLINDVVEWESGHAIQETALPIGSGSNNSTVNLPKSKQDAINFLAVISGVNVLSTDKLEIKLEAINYNCKKAFDRLLLQQSTPIPSNAFTCSGQPITCGGEFIYC